MKTLKLKHTLKLEWRTISGKITDVIWNDNERGCFNSILNDKGNLFICSANYPNLMANRIFIWGSEYDMDNDDIEYTYKTEEQAQNMYNFIMEHTEEEEKKEKEDI